MEHTRRLAPAVLGLLVVVALLGAGCSRSPAPGARTASPPAVTRVPAPTHTAAPTPTPAPTRTPAPTPSPSPTPAPAGRLVAFETERDGNAEVYLLDMLSGELLNLSRHPAEDRAPAWRPDGAALAFASHRDGNWELYLLDLAGGAVQRLTDDPAYDGAPAWSPDGLQIAFESTRGGSLDLYVMPAAGGPAQRLTDSPAGDYGPAWSPAGDSIAFTSWRDGNQEIYLVPVQGGPARNLSQHPADDQDPAWAPGSAALAFVSWRDLDPTSGGRNAELYRLSLLDGVVQRLTDDPWPDLDPAWDAGGRLVWSAYRPGPAFETYDPFRPGDFHLFRGGDGAGPQPLTAADWDDRRPAPAPGSAVDWTRLAALLPPLPAAPGPAPTLAPGALAEVVEVPSILAGKGGPPILVNAGVAPSLLAWQADLLRESGHDFLGQTLGSWRSIDRIRKKEMYAYDYGYLSWHKAGRALDLALEYLVDGADQLVVVRQDLGVNIYWRLYLRAARQDGSQGEPLTDNPWQFWWRIVEAEEPEAYAAGGKRLPIPGGYYVDVTALAKRHGWERIATYAIAGDYDWHTDSNGMEYWHYQRTDGLRWWEAMQQIYPADTLQEYAGWATGLLRAQSPEMMRSKGVPEP